MPAVPAEARSFGIAGRSTRSRSHRIAIAAGMLLAIALALALLGTKWWQVSLAAFPLLLGIEALSKLGRRLDPVPWLKGARGEKLVGRLLDGLRFDGYLLLHDLDIGHGNVNHLAVGPGGVFVVETKAVEGRFYPLAGRLMLNGRSADEYVRQATREAMEVKRRTKGAGVSAWVEALVVATRADVYGAPIRVHGVTLLHADDLVGFIRSKGRGTLSPEQVVHATAALLRDERVSRPGH